MSLGNAMYDEETYNTRGQTTSWIASYQGARYMSEYPQWGSPDHGNLQSVRELSTLEFDQSYTDDGVNRLSSVTETIGNTTNYTRTYAYDAWGNAAVSGGTGTAPNPFTLAPGSFDTATNRISPAHYDAAGNLLTLGWTNLTYDAENRQTQALQGNGNTTDCYDGEGHRVLRTTPFGTTIYVYDAFGQLAAEYSTSTAGIDCHTCYLIRDFLGSTRMVTDEKANLVTRHDYLPFGEEIYGGTTGRDSSFGKSDFVSQKYTGKERDTESGLDYFGARYYGSSMGRMMSPDPLMASAKAWDPQTWNRYAYARNNPLKFIDPTGMAEVNAADCAKDKACVTVNVNVIYDKNANGGKGVSDAQKAGFEKNQLQNAKDQYGNADIHLNVTYTAGEINSKGNLTGVDKGALNVFVTDSGGPASASSGGYAISRINVNSTNNEDLPHQMAHHFVGDMSSALGRTLSQDTTGISRFIDNMFTDVTNDTGRFIMNNVTPHLPNYPSGQPMSVFNPQAREFQKSITPQTHP